jgi:hypothetical protein
LTAALSPAEREVVLAALEKVLASTGYGRVTIEIKDGHVYLVEISTTALVKSANSANQAVIQSSS